MPARTPQEIIEVIRHVVNSPKEPNDNLLPWWHQIAFTTQEGRDLLAEWDRLQELEAEPFDPESFEDLMRYQPRS